MIWIVTSPQRVPEETTYLNGLAAAGPVTLLLRKPGWPLREYAALLDGLQDHSKVMITAYPELLERYNVKGFHMSEGMRGTMSGLIREDVLKRFSVAAFTRAETYNHDLHTRYGNLLLSTSVHTPESPGPAWQYLLLGPVFDSISKQGYSGKGHLFTAIPPNCIAIGGINASNIARARAMGFHGAALLGAIWQNPATAVKNYQFIQSLWDHSL